jgi:tetrahydromethanopterin S-methyltransferase subunit G
MSNTTGSTGGKFLRVFETLDEIKTSLTRLETRDETRKEEIDEIKAKVEAIQKTLYQIVGKESVRSSIYGVIGAMVASLVTWIIKIATGGN